MRLRLAGLGLALVSVLATAAVVQGAHAAPGVRPTRAIGSGAVAVAARRTGTAEPVLLARHRGSVTGDGSTVYVANRTRFRPGPGSVHLPPRLRARSWAVVDLDSGRILGRHRARTRLPQASTMKLLTAVTAARTVPAGTVHRITRYEVRQTCTCAGLKRGRLYGRDTLLAGMLLPSGNDAAEAVAGSHPQGRRAFYAAMNSTARALGATDTVAKNASGLTAAGSHSSARDLVVLLRAALGYPAVAGTLARRSAPIATVAGRFRHTVWRGTDYVNRYPDALGKSGWTTPAQNTLVVVTSIDGHRIAVATMGAPSGYSTTGARALTLWADRNFDLLRGVGALPR